MRAGGAVQAPLVAVVVFAAALVVGGCGLLFPSYPTLPEDLNAPPLALYGNGQATITLADGTKLVLDSVEKDSNLQQAYGASVHWSGGDGWHLRVMGSGSGLGSFAYLSLDRIADGKHMAAWDSSRCIVDVDLADVTGIRGSATCKGLEWYDVMSSEFPFPFASESPGSGSDEPNFDAEIEFEAFPAADAA